MAEQKRGPGRPPGSKNKNTAKKTTSSGKSSGSASKAKAAKSSGNAKKAKAAPADPNAKAVRSDIASIVLLAIGIFLIIALQTNLAGAVGTFIGGFLKGCFGFGAYFLPYFLILYVILAMIGGAIPFRAKTAVLLLILFLGVDLINAGRFLGEVKFGILGIKDIYEGGIQLENGGVFGMYAGGGLFDLIGKAGLYLVSILIILIVLMLLINTPISAFFEKARERKDMRRERKEQKREEERIAAQKAAALEAEKAAKKAEVAKAGRQTSMDYKPLSDLTETMALPSAEELHARRPKSNYAKDFKKLPDNKKNIMAMVQNGDFFDKNETPKGYGLDDTVPDHIGVGYNRQQPNIVSFHDALAMGEEEPDNKALAWQSFAPDAATPVTEEDLFGPKEQWQKPKQESPSGQPESNYEPFEQAAPLDTAEVAMRDAEENSRHIGFLDDSKLADGPYRPAEEKHVQKESPAQTAAAQPQSAAVAKEQPAQKTASGSVQQQAAPHREADFEVGGESVATAASVTESKESVVDATPEQNAFYSLPNPSLLKPTPKKNNQVVDRKALQERAELLESTLESFGVNAKVVNVIAGPSVTRYEVEPARGVKVSSITNLSDDLALSMRARSIRIEAPIPGKAAVGIEIENEQREMVGIREIIESKEFQEHKSKLAFTVGRDIGGKAVVADIAKMPHMLIAGATGSGKSVCINSIIISLLYKAKPEEVKLIMVDQIGRAHV